MGMNKDHTVEELLAEIADSAAREADLRNRAEVAEARRSLDQRIYDVMGKKLYRARQELGMHGPEAAVYLLLDALDDCYALLATLFDAPVEPALHVWKVEDGHPWKESQWPSLRDAGQCDLCTAPQHLHMQVSHD